MHRVTKPIVLAAAALFGLGLVSAVAAETNKDAHGDAVRAAEVAAKALKGAARGEAVSLVASANGKAESAEAKAAKATRDTEKAADRAAKGDRDAHGDAVSMVARSDATAAHAKGKKKVNHGGAVSAAAHMAR
jgi:hypothetical protein